jgi:hypothetical protein
MTAAEFKKKWSRYQGKETSAYQGHFDDLCRLLGQPTPVTPLPFSFGLLIRSLKTLSFSGVRASLIGCSVFRVGWQRFSLKVRRMNEASVA